MTALAWVRVRVRVRVRVVVGVRVGVRDARQHVGTRLGGHGVSLGGSVGGVALGGGSVGGGGVHLCLPQEYAEDVDELAVQQYLLRIVGVHERGAHLRDRARARGDGRDEVPRGGAPALGLVELN